MPKRIYFMCWLLVGLTSKSWSQSEKIISFSFETYTRGYRQKVLIRPDSTFIDYPFQPNQNIRRKTNPNEWQSLIKAVAPYHLPELTNLPAPTGNRTRDAARYSKITIKTDQKAYFSGEFDNYNAPQKLAPVMAKVKQMIGGNP